MSAVVQRGDARAFGRLYNLHTPVLLGIALRQLDGDHAAAEDAVHDAWMRATPKLGTFRWDARLETWLVAFVVRTALSIRRRARREAASPPATEIPADDARLTGVFDRTDLERAIAALPDGYREILLLHDVEGYTHAEIATMRAIAEGTSKSQLTRARAAMRRLLTVPKEG